MMDPESELSSVGDVPNNRLSAIQHKRGRLQVTPDTSDRNPPKAQRMSRRQPTQCHSLPMQYFEWWCIQGPESTSDSCTLDRRGGRDLVLFRHRGSENGWTDPISRLLILGNVMVVPSDSPP
jgi:hypothetical protein